MFLMILKKIGVIYFQSRRRVGVKKLASFAGRRPLLKTLPLEMTRYKYVNLGLQYLIIITVNILQLLILCVVSLTE